LNAALEKAAWGKDNRQFFVPKQPLYDYNQGFGTVPQCNSGTGLALSATAFENRTEGIMSDAHNEHESAIKTPKQLIAAIVAAFLVPIAIIVLLVHFVTGDPKTGAGSEGQTPEAIAARIAPVADQGYTLKDVNAPKQLQDGVAVYKAVCSACHANGTLGAPKFGDAGAWSARIAQGYDTLLSHALGGLRQMPAKGGNADLDDVEVARAVVYMANQAGGKFKEPEVKAAPAAAAAPAASAEAPAASAPAAPVASAAAVSGPAAPAVAAAAPAADAGKKLFDTVCTACHTPGVAGAPKFGDKAAWAPRIKQGVATLYDHALKGFQGKAGMMPPKGGSSAPDADVKAAVDYMVSAAK
jgi:cytochrome c5